MLGDQASIGIQSTWYSIVQYSLFKGKTSSIIYYAKKTVNPLETVLMCYDVILRCRKTIFAFPQQENLVQVAQ